MESKDEKHNNIINNSLKIKSDTKNKEDIMKKSNKLDFKRDKKVNINLNLYDFNKRSYSCKIKEENNEKFSGIKEIRENLKKKYIYLKTPQIKPKKSKLNPIPINIGTISGKKKNSRFKPINEKDIDKNIFNDIISEGETESNKYNSDSDSSSDDNAYAQLNINKEINKENNEENENRKDNINDEFNLMNIHSESKIYSIINNEIREENEEDFNENGDLLLKNLRKKMFAIKRCFLRNNKDLFNINDDILNEKYKKFKEDILMQDKQKQEEKFHNTISFLKPKSNGISILEFLRKNSSIDKTK